MDTTRGKDGGCGDFKRQPPRGPETRPGRGRIAGNHRPTDDWRRCLQQKRPPRPPGHSQNTPSGRFDPNSPNSRRRLRTYCQHISNEGMELQPHRGREPRNPEEAGDTLSDFWTKGLLQDGFTLVSHSTKGYKKERLQKAAAARLGPSPGHQSNGRHHKGSPPMAKDERTTWHHKQRKKREGKPAPDHSQKDSLSPDRHRPGLPPPGRKQKGPQPPQQLFGPSRETWTVSKGTRTGAPTVPNGPTGMRPTEPEKGTTWRVTHRTQARRRERRTGHYTKSSPEQQHRTADPAHPHLRTGSRLRGNSQEHRPHRRSGCKGTERQSLEGFYGHGRDRRSCRLWRSRPKERRRWHRRQGPSPRDYRGETGS